MMRRVPFEYASQWNTGTLTNALIDSVYNISSTNIPSISNQIYLGDPVVSMVQDPGNSPNGAQLLDFSPMIPGNVYYLSWQGATTSLHTYDQTIQDADVLAVLNEIPALSGGVAQVSGPQGGPFTISFPGVTFAGIPVAAIEPNTKPATAAVFDAGWSVYSDRLAICSATGNTADFYTSAPFVEILFSGQLASGQGDMLSGAGIPSNGLRNGAIALIYVDGVQQLQVDTYRSTVKAPVYLDGALHKISIIHSGKHNASVSLLGPVLDVGAGSLSSHVSLVPYFGGSCSRAGTYRITAQSANSLLLEYQDAIEGSVWQQITTFIPSMLPCNGQNNVWGYDTTVTAGFNVGDQATFTTDETMIGIFEFIEHVSAAGGTIASFVTPTIDSGDPNTQWFLAQWISNTLPSSVIIETSQTILSTGDMDTTAPTYQSTTVPTELVVGMSDGDTRVVAGLAAVAPRAQYARVTVKLPPKSHGATPFMRSLFIYYWDPDTDPDVKTKMELAERWIVGQTMAVKWGTVMVALADAAAMLDKYQQGYSLSTANDEYLLDWGNIVGYPWYTGEPAESYRGRLLAAMGSTENGGSADYIVQQLMILITGTQGTIASLAPAISAPGFYSRQATRPITVAGFTSNVTVTVSLHQLGHLGLSINIDTTPTLRYPNLINLPVAQAQSIIISCILSALRPVGAVIEPNLNPSLLQIYFNGQRGTP